MTRDKDNDVTPTENTRAKSLARLVNNLLDGNPAPPALETYNRELLETATAIFATLGARALANEQRARIVDAAFALGHAQDTSNADNIIALPQTSLDDSDLASPERRRLPWAVAAVAVAVALIVSIRAASAPRPGGSTDKTSTKKATDGAKNSPSADILIGRIAKSDSAQASFRMDTIYADRLAAYRTQLLQRGGVK